MIRLPDSIKANQISFRHLAEGLILVIYYSEKLIRYFVLDIASEPIDASLQHILTISKKQSLNKNLI